MPLYEAARAQISCSNYYANGNMCCSSHAASQTARNSQCFLVRAATRCESAHTLIYIGSPDPAIIFYLLLYRQFPLVHAPVNAGVTCCGAGAARELISELLLHRWLIIHGFAKQTVCSNYDEAHLKHSQRADCS